MKTIDQEQCGELGMFKIISTASESKLYILI